MKRKVISAFDVILILIVIVLGIVGIFVYGSHKTPGNVVRITVNGDMVMEKKLISEKKVVIAVKNGKAEEITEEEVQSFVDESTGKNGENAKSSLNIVVIDQGRVSVIEADCPDKICVNHAEISNVGETIICLPNKLIVQVTEQ